MSNSSNTIIQELTIEILRLEAKRTYMVNMKFSITEEMSLWKYAEAMNVLKKNDQNKEKYNH